LSAASITLNVVGVGTPSWFGASAFASAYLSRADLFSAIDFVSDVPKGDMNGSLIAQSIRNAKGAGHLLLLCRVVGLEGCQHVTGLPCDGGHLWCEASSFIERTHWKRSSSVIDTRCRDWISV
jgi:hypothetical protein